MEQSDWPAGLYPFPCGRDTILYQVPFKLYGAGKDSSNERNDGQVEKIQMLSQRWWFKPVIPVTQELETGRIIVQGQPRQN
jgi:hypothetical protein